MRSTSSHFSTCERNLSVVGEEERRGRRALPLFFLPPRAHQPRTQGEPAGLSQRSGSLFAGNPPPSSASAGPPAGYMSGPDRLPDSGIYLAVVVGGWAVGVRSYPSHKGLTNTFLIAAAECHSWRQAQETRRCPSCTITPCYHIPSQEADTHTQEEKPQ